MAKTPSKSSSAAKSKTAAKKSAASKAKAVAKPKTAPKKPKTVTAKAPSKAASLRSKTKAVSARPTAARKAVAKPRLVAVDSATPNKELKKKELIDRIIAESGMKRGEVRTALDATMTVLRQALREGNDLSIAPLGKIKIAREKETPNGKLVVCRVKLKDPDTDARKDPLAKPAE